jgi:hypothetical protein
MFEKRPRSSAFSAAIDGETKKHADFFNLYCQLNLTVVCTAMIELIPIREGRAPAHLPVRVAGGRLRSPPKIRHHARLLLQRMQTESGTPSFRWG